MSRVLPDLFLLTPRHTGTRWIIRNLSKNTLALRQDARNHIHRAERWRPKLARFRKILMTVRHPIDYALAQMNDLSPIRLGVFTTVRHLHEERPELDTFVFRVDCDPEDREASREALQEWLGEPIETWPWGHSEYHNPDLWPCIRENFESTGNFLGNTDHPRFRDGGLINPATAQWLVEKHDYDCSWLRKHYTGGP